MPVQLLLALLKSPASTGAVMPSSRALAAAMAEVASGAELLVELGAGTGPVTQALLQRSPGTPLIAVELQSALANRLRIRFPGVDVREDSAKAVVDELIDHPGKIVLVSSLPFRSLPREVAAETANSLIRFLTANPARRLVQFTYHPRAPFHAPAPLHWQRRSIIWRNTPPAGIWELRQH